MGPMWWQRGPTMNYQDGWSILALMLVLILAVGIVALVIWRGGGATSRHQSRRPEDILRQRYAKGELSRQQYLDALIDILKDRCTRGEIELDEYERRLDVLLEEPLKRQRRELERRIGNISDLSEPVPRADR